MVTRLIRKAALILLIVCSAGAFAEDSDRGRLPDGRAFRTDSQGVQMVDYVAELELSVEELNRKVRGLEGEVSEKQQRIERLQASGKVEPGLAERDLLGGDRPVAAAAGRCPPCPTVKEVRAGERVIDPAGDRREEQCRRDLNSVRDESQIYRAELESARAELAQTKAQLGGRSRELDQLRQVEALSKRSGQEQLTQLRALVQSQQAALGEKDAALAEVQSRMNGLQSQLAAARSEGAGLRSQIAERQKSEAEKDQRLALLSKTGAPSAQPEYPKASVSVEALHGAQSSPLISNRPQLSAARQQAVSGLRSTLNSNINQLRGMAAERDRKFREYGPQGGQLRIRPQPLVSARGLTLDAIGRRVAAAQTVSELSALDRDLRDIRIRVKDDINLINRMMKGRN